MAVEQAIKSKITIYVQNWMYVKNTKEKNPSFKENITKNNW